MSVLNGQPFTVTDELRKAPWGGYKDGRLFRCSWCGHRFETGDTARFIVTNTSEEATKGISGNPFICSVCDGPREEILAKLRAMREEFMHPKYWWFRNRVHNEGSAEGAREESREQARIQREEREARIFAEERRLERGE